MKWYYSYNWVIPDSKNQRRQLSSNSTASGRAGLSTQDALGFLVFTRGATAASGSFVKKFTKYFVNSFYTFRVKSIFNQNLVPVYYSSVSSQTFKKLDVIFVGQIVV